MNTEPNPEDAILRSNLDADDFEQRRQIDRLVSGDLAQVERAELLMWLDEVPGRWRRCGLAFLEVQTISQALQRLPDEESGGPRLVDQSSADLIGQLQTELAPSSTSTRTRRSPLAICLGAAAAAALVIAVIWISNPEVPGTNQEAADRARTDSDSSARRVQSIEFDENVRDMIDLIETESEMLDNEIETAGVEPFVGSTSERGIYVFSLSGSTSEINESVLRDALVTRPTEHEMVEIEPNNFLLLLSAVREVGDPGLLAIANHNKAWRNISATAAHAEMLYVVDSGQLYEVRLIDGSYRIVGDDDWKNTAAMGAGSRSLYIVSDKQLYEVNPTTGARRTLGKPEWGETQAIVTVGDKLYIVGDRLLHHVNPNDGSHEVLHEKKRQQGDAQPVSPAQQSKQ